MVLAVSEAVEDAGQLNDAQLPDAVEAKLGVNLPGKFRPLVSGFAYQANVLHYVRRDEDADCWRVGLTAPAPDARWADWTPAKIAAAVRSNGDIDDDLIGRIFSGRPGKTVRRAIRAAAGGSGA
jgi:hypothetical protein